MGGTNAAGPGRAPASTCPSFIHVKFSPPIDPSSPSGILTADLMTTTGYSTENVWVQLGQNVTTNGVTVQATGETIYRPATNVNFDFVSDTGTVIFRVSGTYSCNAYISVKRVEGSGGTREMFLGIGCNGEIIHKQSVTSQQSNRWIATPTATIINANKCDTLALFVNQVNDGGGSGVNDMEITDINLVLVKIT